MAVAMELRDAVRKLLLTERAEKGTDAGGTGWHARDRRHLRARLHQGPARPRPHHPHLRRAAPVGFHDVAVGAQRVLLLRGAVARLPPRRLPARAAQPTRSASAATGAERPAHAAYCHLRTSAGSWADVFHAGTAEDTRPASRLTPTPVRTTGSPTCNGPEWASVIAAARAGAVVKARATAARCFSPPDSAPARASACDSSPT
jgi:hypothetical protein